MIQKKINLQDIKTEIIPCPIQTFQDVQQILTIHFHRNATSRLEVLASHIATNIAALDPAPEIPIIELYMHDILGGNSPTARPITGLPGNIYSGQVPFARPVGFLPPKGGVAIPNARGALPTVKTQGVYVASSACGSTQMMAFIAMIEGGEYGDSLNFFGVYKIGSTMSRLSVTGGTGKFKNACGFAEVRSLIPAGQQISDGVETLLRITIHLTYRNCLCC